MKNILYFLMALSVASCVYNTAQINFSTPFKGDSQIALIGILASLCAFILLLILHISYRIKEKQEDH